MSRIKRLSVLICVLSLVFLCGISMTAKAEINGFYEIDEENAMYTDDFTYMGINTVKYTDGTYYDVNYMETTGWIWNGAYDCAVSVKFRTEFYDGDFNYVGAYDYMVDLEAGEEQGYGFGTTDNDLLDGYTIEDVQYFQVHTITIDSEYSMEEMQAKKAEKDLTPSQKDDLASMDYVIDAYDVNMTVFEDNSMHITETIDAYFHVPKHGIFRRIPLRNKVERLDGTTSYNRAVISGVSVNDSFTESSEGGNRVFKIGDADTTLEGEKQYELTYTYELGKDTGNGYDELYYNIIGNSWDTYIGHVTFTITMPEAFDASKLGFSKGRKGTVDSSEIEYEVNGNVITGHYNGILSPEEALTVRLELPEGYFYLAENQEDSPVWMMIMIVVPLILVGIAGALWYQYGRDDAVTDTVEFYPPTGMNSLDVAFCYYGKLEPKDITSLLIYLANKGYYKISDTVEKLGPFKSEGFQITRLKYYDGIDPNEQLFYHGLFNSRRRMLWGDTGNEDPDVVTNRDLRDEFYKTTNLILKNQNKREYRNMIFESGLGGRNAICILLLLGIFVLMTVKPVVEYAGGEGVMTIVMSSVGLLLALSSLRQIFTRKNVRSAVFSFGFSALFLCAMLAVPMRYTIVPAMMFNPKYTIVYVIDLLCMVGVGVFYYLMPKRTPYGNEMLGKIRGFKRFLETAEKERLEAMVMENPTYFYDILPYTYVLGVSDKWIKKFETIFMDMPSWYDGHNIRNRADFGHFMNQMMSTATSSMGASGSGGSGGGSSGGGSGGGGGGSW